MYLLVLPLRCLFWFPWPKHAAVSHICNYDNLITDHATASSLSCCSMFYTDYSCFRSAQRFATSLRQPHPAGVLLSSICIPAASQISITTCLTALTSSGVAPPLSAPLRCPFSWGFTCLACQYGTMYGSHRQKLAHILWYQTRNHDKGSLRRRENIGVAQHIAVYKPCSQP